MRLRGRGNAIALAMVLEEGAKKGLNTGEWVT
jgi:hypothetical protein